MFWFGYRHFFAVSGFARSDWICILLIWSGFSMTWWCPAILPSELEIIFFSFLGPYPSSSSSIFSYLLARSKPFKSWLSSGDFSGWTSTPSFLKLGISLGISGWLLVTLNSPLSTLCPWAVLFCLLSWWDATKLGVGRLLPLPSAPPLGWAWGETRWGSTYGLCWRVPHFRQLFCWLSFWSIRFWFAFCNSVISFWSCLAAS